MEPIEEISQEWMSCLSEVYTEEEADFMNQLLHKCSIPEQLYERFNLETKYIFPTTNAGNCSNNLDHVSIGFSIQGNDAKLMNENTEQELGLDTGRENLADMDLQAHKARQILVSEPEKDNSRSMEKSEKRFRSSFEVEYHEVSFFFTFTSIITIFFRISFSCRIHDTWIDDFHIGPREQEECEI